MDSIDYGARFGGVSRLLGEAALARLSTAHVAVVGLGGVGSWVCEALARSGLGSLTLVDLDEVCITNINRQLPALTSTVGRPKAVVLAERARDIQPALQVHPITEFFTRDTASALLAPPYDCVIDAIDSPSLKALLIASCHAPQTPVITSGGAGGRRDPTRVRVADLAHTSHDPLLGEVRRILRRDHGFPRGEAAFGVECVFSTEAMCHAASGGTPEAPAETGSDQRAGRASGCERSFGTACFVTGTFGFVIAARVVEWITCRVGPQRRA